MFFELPKKYLRSVFDFKHIKALWVKLGESVTIPMLAYDHLLFTEYFIIKFVPSF